jgi:hypothetical protein
MAGDSLGGDGFIDDYSFDVGGQTAFAKLHLLVAGEDRLREPRLDGHERYS